MDIKGARGRSHEPAAKRTKLGLREPESTHCWTGTPCRAASLACSHRSEEKDVGHSRLGLSVVSSPLWSNTEETTASRVRWAADQDAPLREF